MLIITLNKEFNYLIIIINYNFSTDLEKNRKLLLGALNDEFDCHSFNTLPKKLEI
jgi:hypothetical protein